MAFLRSHPSASRSVNSVSQMQTNGVKEDSKPSLLVVIVDADEHSWRIRSEMCLQSQIVYDELVSSIVMFCNSYLLMNRNNRLAVLASHTGGCNQIYPRAGKDSFEPLPHTLPQILASGLLNPGLTSGMANNGKSDDEYSKNRGGRALALCLSKALCIINRQIRSSTDLQARILVTKIASDHTPSYNSVMNSIFSADKLDVPVDSVILSKSDSHFMQQASFLTRGVYLNPSEQRDLLQLLMMYCLSSRETRMMGLQTPIQAAVDFRASCFCHNKSVEFAYMCSVCLALTCAPSDLCATCSSPRASTLHQRQS